MFVLCSVILVAGSVVTVDAVRHFSPPSLIQGIQNMTIRPGALFQMECKAEGAPTPKLTITRLEEASLVKVKRRNYTGMDLKMSVTHVIYKSQTVQANDEGWYRCVAANSRGVVFSDAYLSIYDLCAKLNCRGGKICVTEGDTAKCVCRECSDTSYNPLCGSDCVTHFNYCQLEQKNCLRGTKYTSFLKGSFCPLFTPPKFVETPPRELDVVEGKAFTLTCKAGSDGDVPGPPPLISWYVATVAPTEDTEGPTVFEPDLGQKLGNGETIKLRTTDYMDVICVAHQCQYGQSMPQDIVSDPVSVFVAFAELNVWNGGPSCQIFGDPHIITFDDVAYEYEGRCEYVLAMDCEKKTWFVYGSFGICSTHGRGACLESVTLYLNYDIAIEVSRGMLVNHDGNRLKIPESGLVTITGNAGSVVYAFMKDDWLVLKFLNDGDSHYELRWDGLMSAQILLGKNHPTTCGLCGNANGDPTDDYQTRWKGKEGRISESVEKFGDSWRIDRSKRCKKAANKPKWEWEKDFPERLQEATRICDKMFNSTQLSKCAQGSGFGSMVDPKPYISACISDYARSDFFPDDMSGQSMACVAAMNFAERCGNSMNKNHLWREECGCAGETEELEEFKKFLGEFSCFN